MRSAKPTLLVFTLGAARERERRRLLPGRGGSLEHELHRHCLQVAVTAGLEAGCEVVVSSPRPLELPAAARSLPQRGRSFGARFRDAMRRCAPGGPLLVVGTDVPGLTADHLRESLRRLARDPERVVIGPSPDGGFYLLAAARPVERELAAVRWCRRDTLRTLRAAFAASGTRVALLAPLRDLDRRRDLERWLTGPVGLLGRRLVARLRALLRRLARPPAPPLLAPLPPALPAALPVRGPPR